MQVEDVCSARFRGVNGGIRLSFLCVPVFNKLADRADELAGGETKKNREHVCVFFLATVAAGTLFNEKLYDAGSPCVELSKEKNGIFNCAFFRAGGEVY